MELLIENSNNEWIFRYLKLVYFLSNINIIFI